MVSGFAFLHHLAAFTFVAALAIEFVLLRGTLSAKLTLFLLVGVLSIYPTVVFLSWRAAWVIWGPRRSNGTAPQ
jgi:uncharacterized membrane protein